MNFSRINPVFGVFPSFFCALILGACGDDASVDFEQYQDSEAYCFVNHTSVNAVLEMHYPDVLKAKIEVIYNGKTVVSKLEETFYEKYNLDIDSLCESKEEMVRFEPETFQCDQSGLSYVVVSDAEGYSDVMETTVANLNAQCDEFEESRKLKGIPAIRAGLASAGSSYSRSSSSGVSSSRSSSSGAYQLPKTKIIKKGNNDGFTDKRDGNVYRVVQVGDHVWMLDNLRFAGNAKYPLVGETYCTEDCDGFRGVLYDFAAAMNNASCEESLCNRDNEPVQGACPEDWLLPSQSDWAYLEENLENVNGFFNDPTGEWAGYWHNDKVSRFWTSSEDTEKSGIEYYYIMEKIKHQGYGKSMGYGIRCVATKDVTLDAIVELNYSSSTAKSSSSVASSGSYSSSALYSSSVLYSSSEPSSSESKPLVEGVKELPTTKIIKNGDNNAITDKRDGKVYRVVQVGDQVWMLDNLGFVGNAEYPLAGKAFCKEGCTELQGALYDYAGAMNYSACSNQVCNPDDLVVQGACPEGWGLPRAHDWSVLKYTIEETSAFFPNPTGEWMSSSWKNDGISRFWTSTEQNSNGAYEYYYRHDSIESQTYGKSSGYGVRCVALKDVTPDALVQSSSSIESSSSMGYSVPGESSSSFMEPLLSSSDEPELSSSSVAP